MANPRPHALAAIEGRLPPEIAEKGGGDGVAKAGQDAIPPLSLSVLGGGFIAFGAIFATVVFTGAEGVLPFSIARVVAGLVFALGLSLVLIGGVQIATDDVLMVMAWQVAGCRPPTWRASGRWCGSASLCGIQNVWPAPSARMISQGVLVCINVSGHRA